MRTLRTIHRFCSDYGCYRAVVLAGSAYGLLWLRHRLSYTPDYWILTINLLLAIVPYVAAITTTLAVRAFPYHRAALLIPSAIWLLFLPNGPYLATDIVHMSPGGPFSLWYDTAMLAILVLAGCMLAAESLWIMQGVVRTHAGRYVAAIFVVLCAFLTGIGVYLGRVTRLNSWEVFTKPVQVAQELYEMIVTPTALRQAGIVTATYALLLLLCYLFVNRANSASRERS